MVRRRTGTVVGKDFRPPPGKDHDRHCYLVVDIADDELVTVRLGMSDVDKAVIGDRVEFFQRRGHNTKAIMLRRMG